MDAAEIDNSNCIGTFGDKRLCKIGTLLYSRVIERGTVCLRQLSDDRATQRRFHRLLEHHNVTPQEITRHGSERTAQAAAMYWPSRTLANWTTAPTRSALPDWAASVTARGADCSSTRCWPLTRKATPAWELPTKPHGYVMSTPHPSRRGDPSNRRNRCAGCKGRGRRGNACGRPRL